LHPGQGLPAGTQDYLTVLRKLVTDRIGGMDDEVDEFIDWQLMRYLSG
jgi:hypothetical protein